ncbi:SUMF1/EgtB/PvdO family nonheme iron enzyme [bacterium]|nr:SUMF1/EgtB/PvdO family nonheme iron enzyme [bacterium]
MKKAILFSIVALLCVTALCDEAWSQAGSFDGSELTQASFLLRPTDSLYYSSALADGTPVSLTIGAVDQSDSTKTDAIFSDNSGTAVEGYATWDYTTSDLPKNDTYTITETVVSSYETKSLSRSVTILPEPAILALLVIAGSLFLRKRVKALVAILALVSVSAIGAKADVVSGVAFQQMLPFTRDVAITYTVTPAANTIYDVKFYGSTDNGATVFDLQDRGELHLSVANLNETFCSAGTHEVVWTPDESFYSTKVNNFKVKVEATAISSASNYLVIDLSGGTQAASYPVSYLSDVPSGGWSDDYKTTKMVMRLIPAGTYIMGSPEGEVGRKDGETQHKVTLTKPFYAGVFEVTQNQYELVTGSTPSEHQGNARPVERVSYNMLRGTDKGAGWPANNEVDEDSFFGILRDKTGLSFDLPTEAQWEFACRAETTTALNSGKNLTGTNEDANMNEVGRYSYNQNDGKGGYSQHTTVGSYLPNAWGLYDMHGNVYEWCLDWSGSYGGNAVDPKGASVGTNRDQRGGGWKLSAQYCRSSYRSGDRPFANGSNQVGFRVFLVQ